MSNSSTSSAPNNEISCAVNRKPPSTTGLSSLSLNRLIQYMDNVLSAIINQGLGCKLIDSRTELRDLVQPVASDFSKLFDGISEGAQMFLDQKFLKSQLSTEAHSMAVEVLKGLGNAHWVAVGLLAIANVLERFDNISANDRECIDLLKAMLKLGKFLKQMKDINADLHNEILEDMSEAVKLVVSGAILCCSFITSNKLSKFLLTKKIRDELVYVRGKVDSMKADLMLQMQVLTVNTLTFYLGKNNVTGKNEENNCHGVTEQDPSEQSKDTQSEIEQSCETELEESGSNTISSGGRDIYNGVNQHELLGKPLRSSLGLGRFLKKRIPALFRLQKPSPYIELHLTEIPLSLIEFKRDELKRATNGFTEKIGEGGFGSVYRGNLPDGRQVAVKTMSKTSMQGETAWMNELRTLTKLHHRNIAELVGFCFEDNMLVYEYIPRNLARAIFEEIEMVIDWPTRLKIILDIIKALSYLHEGADVCIVHRDIKPSNILLDENFNAKISDFGLARIMEADYAQYANEDFSTDCKLFLKDITNFSGYESTRIAGTLGYLAPEYARRGHLSAKSDIFSFGVLLLNVVTGKRVTETTDGELSYVLEHAWRLSEEDRLHELIDSRLLNTDGLINSSSISRTIITALWCTHIESERRPSSSRVLAMLLSEEEIPIPARSTAEPYSRFDQSHATMLSGESSESSLTSGESFQY